MREIVFDTETTGLKPQSDRIVEIGCVELINHFPTGRTWHTYCNPQRGVERDAYNVHGLSIEFLADKPLFSTIVDDLLEFIGDAKLVAHNGRFDLAFLNAELARLKRPAIGDRRLVDTLALARRKHPAGPNKLDDLCKRYKVDLSKRTKHSALLDCRLLADVYIELIDARQSGLALEVPGASAAAEMKAKQRPVPLPSRVSDADRSAHRAFVGQIKDAIWNQYLNAA